MKIVLCMACPSKGEGVLKRSLPDLATKRKGQENSLLAYSWVGVWRKGIM